MHFLDAFLLHCLLSDSPTTDEVEHHQLQENQARIVYRGREPGLKLWSGDSERAMDEWGKELLTSIGQSAALLDASFGGDYLDRKSTRLNSSHVAISYAVFCLKKKTKEGTDIEIGNSK